jgi:hypothetical protein
MSGISLPLWKLQNESLPLIGVIGVENVELLYQCLGEFEFTVCE